MQKKYNYIIKAFIAWKKRNGHFILISVMPLCVAFYVEKYSIPNANYMLVLQVFSAVTPCSLSGVY